MNNAIMAGLPSSYIQPFADFFYRPFIGGNTKEDMAVRPE
jgi:hypothetical protein